MRFEKKGIIGEGIIMIYRLLVISFVAFVILGVSSVFYSHYIDVRNAEARILARDVVDCVSPSGFLDMSYFVEGDENKILSYCGFDESEVERFYVEVLVSDSEKEVAKFSQGDRGALWVLQIADEKFFEGDLGKYKPGYFDEVYPTYILSEGEKVEGNIRVEVFVGDEF